MIVSLEVTSGPLAGKGVRLQPGQTLTVGRTAKSHFVVPGDDHISGMHFRLAVDESACILYDMNSRNGTLLNGSKVGDAAVLRTGDLIVAGETNFAINIIDDRPAIPEEDSPAPSEGVLDSGTAVAASSAAAPFALGPAPMISGGHPIAPRPAHAPVEADEDENPSTMDDRPTAEAGAEIGAPAPGVEPSATPPEPTPHQRLLKLFREEYQPLYAILDAARAPRILALLLQTKEQYESLYEGVQGAKLSQVAPYLVRLEKDSLLLGSLILEGWGQNWGVYLTCDAEFAELRRHLRRFLEVQLPDGKQVYFRFYDPRVLRVYLPTCTAEETNQFFGPIKQYVMEEEKPDKLLQFMNTGRGADGKVVELTVRAVRDEKRPSSTSEEPAILTTSKPLSGQSG